MGGSDQWGNITTGTELIRRMGGGQAFAVTAPLIKKADGSKFGKSEGGNIWLDKRRTSAYQFYQYWINSADEDAARYIRIFTLKTKEEIEAIEAEHAQDPGARVLQKSLAADVTTRVHSAEDLATALAASEILFGKSTRDHLTALPESEFLSVFSGVPQATIARHEISGGVAIVDLLTDHSGFLSSKGEARRALKENSISVNKEKVNEDITIGLSDLLNGKQILLQRGKKKYFLLNVD